MWNNPVQFYLCSYRRCSIIEISDTKHLIISHCVCNANVLMPFSNIDAPESTSIFTTTTTTAVVAPDTSTAGGVSISFGKILPHIHSHTNVNLHEQLHQVSMLLHQSRHISSIHSSSVVSNHWYYSSTAVSSFTFICSISLTSFFFSYIRSSRVHNIMCFLLGSVEDSAKFSSPYTPPIPTQTTTNTGKRCSGLALTHRLFREPTSENNDYSITLISTTSVYNHWLGELFHVCTKPEHYVQHLNLPINYENSILHH